MESKEGKKCMRNEDEKKKIRRRMVGATQK